MMDGDGDVVALQERMGYRFRDGGLLAAALTHRSYRFEHAGVDADNERLEFLGDSILGTLATEHLYRTFTACDEGRLTALRSRVTSGKALAHCAREIGLGACLRMGQGEARTGGCMRASNLANALEALLGAAYLDGGLEAARTIFNEVILRRAAGLDEDPWADNPKGRIQELAQSRWRQGPRYEVLSAAGPAHAPHYTVKLTLPDGSEATGEGSSKQAAEAAAAEAMLEPRNVASGAASQG